MPTAKNRSAEGPKFGVRREGSAAIVEIYDDIGPGWLGMIDAKSVAEGLAAAGEVSRIEVRLNSLGGASHDGLAIYNLLKAHPATVRVRIDGVAASSASLIAMAGDEVLMPAGALMMIHEPWTIAVGDAADMRKAAVQLDSFIDAAIEVYSSKSEQSDEQLRAWLAAETWFTGAEAVEAGLADKVEGEVFLAYPLNADHFKYRKQPQQFYQLVALSASRPPTKEQTMPKSTNTAPPKTSQGEEQTKTTDAKDADVSQETKPETKPEGEKKKADPAPADPQSAFKAELQKFVARFGAENGARWMAEGKSYQAACELHIEAQAAQLAAKDKAIAELQTKIASIDTGETEPATFSSGEAGDGNKGKSSRFAHTLSPGLARFAAGLKLPSNN